MASRAAATAQDDKLAQEFANALNKGVKEQVRGPLIRLRFFDA